MTAAPTPAQLNETAHDQQQQRHPLDALVPDPTGVPPLCDEQQFVAILESMVADEAPRLFAVVQEYGNRVDAQIVAWGMAFADHAEVVSVDRSLRMSLRKPKDTLPAFHFGSHIRARLVWFNPDATTPGERDQAA
ncbi:hypothetical protein [Gandjariella thermophila]|nr:hypothetical protein [Gandjariella thermophila]